MGAEVSCDVVIDGRKMHGTVRLETSTLEFRAPGVKTILAFSDIVTIATCDGVLRVTTRVAALAFALGAPTADRWKDKIRHPLSRLKKLGMTSTSRVAIIGQAEAGFVDELRATVSHVSRGRSVQGADAIFLFVDVASDLARIDRLKTTLAPAGALWLLRPKGNAVLTERAIMAAGRDAGLVDVKVVGFSETRSALKFVIPVTQRPQKT